ncbi:MAG: protein kinase [Actinobacteria bacterium]|nr:protein kinase [Actinomycetota bacterium]
MAREPVVISERYALEEEIARGGMAVVWRARDEVLARTVAVKLLHPHLASDEGFLERFRTEALAAARLTHPNVVATYDTGSDTTTDGVDRHFIVMEYCGGGTLRSRLDADGPMDAARALGMGAAVASALSYAHANEIIHRDIKPANILLTEDGALKVGDFGIAKAATITGDVTTTGKILGTVAYLAPEQAAGIEPDSRSDLYSLGCVLYELLTGRPPFVEETQLTVAMKHLREPVLPLRSIRANIPRTAEHAVMKALEKDPDDRYSSADEMRAALESARGGTGRTAVLRAAPRRSSERGRPARSRRPSSEPSFSLWPVVLLIAAGVALAILVPRLMEQTGRDDAPGGDGGPPTASAVEIRGVEDFDPPPGDGEEHADETDLVHDEDESTFWRTENYSTSLEAQGKPGVGLVVDLGEVVEVEEIEIVTSTPGLTYELRAATEMGEAAEDFDQVEAVQAADASERVDADRTPGRYWLLWITELPGGGGGSAGVSEVRFFAS